MQIGSESWLFRILSGIGALAACAAAWSLASKCDASDSLQVLTIFGFPPIAGLLVGAVVWSFRPSAGPLLVGAAVAVACATTIWLLTFIVWIDNCAA